MGYVRTAGMSTAARRARRRAALVITTLLLGLVLVFSLAFASMQGWITFPGGSGGDTADTTAATVPPPALRSQDIVVNVYNSTQTAGLAGRAAESLRERNFQVDTVGNAGEAYEGVGVIRYVPEGERAARALRDALPDGVDLEELGEDGSGTDRVVDLILGTEWEDLPGTGDGEGDGSGDGSGEGGDGR
ncbi:LytR C-terminal domain-containing protein [Ornithinimicrobium sp. Y1847]|uniref:LytR C-terminal domain-containing protein n=1 Tax=unclassified Ornithinimicrobium TaxID=2615080 RepID=UPI003B673BA0